MMSGKGGEGETGVLMTVAVVAAATAVAQELGERE